MLCEYLAKTCILNGLHMPQYHLSGWKIIFVIYITVKCLGSVRIFTSLKEVSSVHKGCIYLIKMK